MFEFKDAKAVAETLWGLKETLGALRSSCDHLSEALSAQENRIRSIEMNIVELRADIKISEISAKLAAVEKAVESASNLVSNVHGPLVQKISDLRADLDSLNNRIKKSSLPLLDGRENGQNFISAD